VTFLGEIFFFKSAQIFACAFQFGSKAFPCIFLAVLHFVSEKNEDKRRANRGGKTGKIMDLNRHSNYPPCTCAFVTCMTSTRTNKGAKNLKNGFLLFHLIVFIVHSFSSFFSETKCTFEEKNFTQKSHLRLSRTKPFNSFYIHISIHFTKYTYQ